MLKREKVAARLPATQTFRAKYLVALETFLAAFSRKDCSFQIPGILSELLRGILSRGLDKIFNQILVDVARHHRIRNIKPEEKIKLICICLDHNLNFWNKILSLIYWKPQHNLYRSAQI